MASHRFTIAFLSLVLASSGGGVSLSDYVEQCKREGVSIPTADQLSPAGMDEVPIWKTLCEPGKPPRRIQITEENYDQYAKDGKLTCDNPVVVGSGDHCIPGNLVKVITFREAPATSCLYILRRYERARTAEQKKKFEDGGLICHDASNGATCYFKLAEARAEVPFRKFSSFPVPGSPDDRTWAKPHEYEGTNCMYCHDRGPYVLSGHLLEPPLGNKLKAQLKKVIRPFGPYYAVRVDDFPPHPNRWRQPLSLRGGDAADCTTCHRITSTTCQSLLDYSVGRSKPVGINESCPGKSYAPMPPDGHPENYEETIAYIKNCCKELSLPPEKRKLDCEWKDTPGKPGTGRNGMGTGH